MPRTTRSCPPIPGSSTNPTPPQTARHAVFENCQNITVSGGTFNIQTTTHEHYETDFATIKLGHLKLVKEVARQTTVEHHEIRHKRTGVVKRCVPVVTGIRTVHQARIVGFQEDFTAVVYEGSDFEKHRSHAEQREEFRHPSLVQLFGVTSSNRLKALIYNDGLIPLDEFRTRYKESPMTSACVEYKMACRFDAAVDHWKQITGAPQLVLNASYRQRYLRSTTLWIRISSRQLCVEVDTNSKTEYAHVTRLSWERPDPSITGDPLTSDIGLDPANMGLDDIHCIFSVPIGRLNSDDIRNPGPAPCTILLGSLSVPAPNYLHMLSQISVSDGLGLADGYAERWEFAGPYSSPSPPVTVQLPNGWTRLGLADLPLNGECYFRAGAVLTWEAELKTRKSWLSQANHIMYKTGLSAGPLPEIAMYLVISSNLDEFTLRGTFMADSESVRDEIYLFLFPPAVDASGGHLAVHLPPANETHYWSFDPDGAARLSQEAVEELALPTVHFLASAQGFDPTSQDVAIELGYSLVDVDRLNNLINRDKIVEVVDEVQEREDEVETYIMYSSLM